MQHHERTKQSVQIFFNFFFRRMGNVSASDVQGPLLTQNSPSRRISAKERETTRATSSTDGAPVPPSSRRGCHFPTIEWKQLLYLLYRTYNLIKGAHIRIHVEGKPIP